MESNLIIKEDIFFSVIIPTYNRSPFVKKIVESFQKQTYPNFELIIVDDGSVDNTRTIIENIEDSRIKYFWKENGERGSARNFGAKQAKGNYLNYFDSDDIAYPNHLEKAVEGINLFNNPMLLHLGYEMRNENNGLLFRHKAINNNANERILKVNYINPNSLFIHSSTLNDVTYNCDRKIAGTEDWLYHLQLIARYKLIAYDEKITSCIIVHENRSMNNYCGDEVLNRNTLLLKYLSEDSIFKKRYRSKFNCITAEMHSLAALHYMLERKRWRSLKAFCISLFLRPTILLKRRTLGIAKHLILSLQRRKLS